MTDDKTAQCIRCDEEISVSSINQFKTLTYDQETGALPICHSCFQMVKNRNLWL